jgi:dCTP diphosphatase
MNSTSSAGSPDLLQELRNALRQFAAERDWDKFHSQKNLAIALNVEAAELLEHFQWLSDAESAAIPPEKQIKVRQELADVLLYLVRLADKLDVDLAAAAAEKLDLNARKYPIDKARGSSKKYTEL